MAQVPAPAEKSDETALRSQLSFLSKDNANLLVSLFNGKLNPAMGNQVTLKSASEGALLKWAKENASQFGFNVRITPFSAGESSLVSFTKAQEGSQPTITTDSLSAKTGTSARDLLFGKPSLGSSSVYSQVHFQDQYKSQFAQTTDSSRTSSLGIKLNKPKPSGLGLSYTVGKKKGQPDGATLAPEQQAQPVSAPKDSIASLDAQIKETSTLLEQYYVNGRISKKGIPLLEEYNSLVQKRNELASQSQVQTGMPVAKRTVSAPGGTSKAVIVDGVQEPSVAPTEEKRLSKEEFVALLSKENPYLTKAALDYLGKLYAGETKYSSRELVFGKKKNAENFNKWILENGQKYGFSLSGVDLSSPSSDKLYHLIVKKEAQPQAAKEEAGSAPAPQTGGGVSSVPPNAPALGFKPSNIAWSGYMPQQFSQNQGTSALNPGLDIQAPLRYGDMVDSISKESNVLQVNSGMSSIYSSFVDSFVQSEFAEKFMAPPSTVEEAKQHSTFYLLSIAKVSGFLPAEFDVKVASEEQKLNALQSLKPDFWKNLGTLLVSGSASMEIYGGNNQTGVQSALESNISLARERQKIDMEGMGSILHLCGFELEPKHDADFLTYKNSDGLTLSLVRGPVYVGGEEITSQQLSLLDKGKHLSDSDVSQINSRQLNNFLFSLSKLETSKGKGADKIAEWEKSNLLEKDADGSYSLLDAKKFNAQIKRVSPSDSLKIGRDEHNPEDVLVRSLYTFRGMKILGTMAQALSLETKQFIKSESGELAEISPNTPIPKGTDVYVLLDARRIMENGSFEEKAAEFEYSILRYSYDSISGSWSSPAGLSPDLSTMVEEGGKKYIKFTAGSEEDTSPTFYTVQARAKNSLGMETTPTQTYLSAKPREVEPEYHPFPAVKLPMRENKEPATIMISQLGAGQDAGSTMSGFLPQEVLTSLFDNLQLRDTGGTTQIYNWLESHRNYRQNWVNEFGSEANYQAFWNAINAGNYVEAYNMLPDGALKNAFALSTSKEEVRKLAQQYSYDVIRYGATLSVPVLKDKDDNDIISVGVSVAKTQSEVSFNKLPIGSSTTMAYGANVAWIAVRKNDLKVLFGLDATQVREGDKPVSYVLSARSSASVNLSTTFSASALLLGSTETYPGVQPTVRGQGEATLNARFGSFNIGAGPLADFSDLKHPQYGFTVPMNINWGNASPYLRLDYAGTPVVYGGITFAIPGLGGTTLSAYTQRERRR